ncbi:MAG: DUF4286 family protein [Duncaniella sp.]|nr:DUF4286 family protein [Duncaniella sp.]
MIIFNTTFHVHELVVESFKKWIKDVYIPDALLTDGVSSLEFARIMIEVQEGYASFAVQFKADSHETAVEWHDGRGAALRNELISRFGDRILFFTTYMELISQGDKR